MFSITYLCNIYGFLAIALCLLWYYSTSTFGYWRQRNVKFVKPIIPLFDFFVFMLSRRPTHLLFHNLYTYFGDQPYGGMYQLRKPILFVKDRDVVNDVLVKDFKYFHDRDIRASVNFNKDLNPLNEQLTHFGGERWRILRQKMSPIFTSGKLKHMHEQMYDCIRVLDRYITTTLEDGSAYLEMNELFQNLTIDVIGCCAFGLSCSSAGLKQFKRMGKQIFKFEIRDAIRMTINVINQKILNLIRFPDMKKEVQDFYVGVVLDTMSYRRRTGAVRNDALQLLMNLQNTHRDEKYAVADGKETILKNEEFDEVDIAANAFLFFVAGYGTTATTLSFCVYELAINRDIQNKLRLEVEQVQGRYPKQTAESLKELTYMDMVIKETLRKYPIALLLSRVCTTDYIFPRTKMQISAGTGILIPIWSIHHDPKYYPDPEIFDPNRFSPENEDSRPNGTYIPFGDGPRFCIGKRFAEMVVKSALAELILEYEFSPCSKTEIPLTYKPNFFLVPKNGIFIRITKRNC